VNSLVVLSCFRILYHMFLINVTRVRAPERFTSYLCDCLPQAYMIAGQDFKF
jgi:hypothetical protein